MYTYIDKEVKDKFIEAFAQIFLVFVEKCDQNRQMYERKHKDTLYQIVAVFESLERKLDGLSDG